MKISSIRIQNFRSIEDTTLSINQILAIVGANNTGKSHVLRALNSFFNYESEQLSFLNGDHIYSRHSRPKITVTFTEILNEDDISSDYINNGKLTIKFWYRWDRKNPTYEVLIPSGKPITIDIDTFERITSHYRFIYVPIIRNYNIAFSENNGLAYRLLKQILTKQTYNRNTIQPIIDKLLNKFDNTVFKSTIKELKKYYPFESDVEFQMNISNMDLSDTILHNVVLSLIENSQKNSLDNCGSGIQSAVYFALSLAISMREDINYLVGIEEPELNMHPQAQRQLIDSLQDNSRYPNSQFILTTHSTVLIDKLGHTSIALCRKDSTKSRDVVSRFTQLDENFWEKYDFTDERYYNFFAYKNSDFFFSNYIIITESSADCNIISALLKKYGIDIERVGISLIPASGERSIKYPYALAKDLKIPFLCLVDHDVFRPYSNNSRKDSLNEYGIPKYKQELKSSSPILSLIKETDKHKLLDSFNSEDYNTATKILLKYNIISMRYAIEVDFALCKTCAEKLYEILNVSLSNRNTTFLLVNLCNKIKEYNVINAALNSLNTQSLPKSYKEIIKYMKNLIEKKDKS